MERQKIVGPAGHVPAGHTVLMLSGSRGAVTLSAWTHQAEDHGVLGIHYKTPMYEGQQATPCEYLPEGCCYGDTSFAIGHDEAPSILAGYDNRAWVTLLSFYKERIDPEGEDHE